MRYAIKAYRFVLAPVFPAGGCRFHPTCSYYAEDAITRHGPFRGSWLALMRIIRCHPWGQAGVDPVPPLKSDIVPSLTTSLTQDFKKAAG